MEEGAETQEVGGRIVLFDFAEGERPGSCNRLVLHFSLFLQQSRTPLLITLDIAPQSTSLFFDVSACLSQCQRKSAQHLNSFCTIASILVIGCIKWGFSGQ